MRSPLLAAAACGLVLCFIVAPSSFAAGGPSTRPRPVPAMQAVPQPHRQVSFQLDAVEVARYHYGADLRRPFLFPVIGPSGRSLTRMGHPHDPEGHSHHNSVWVSHESVAGVSFWRDNGKGRIAHQQVEAYDEDAATASAWLTTRSAWIDEGSGRTLLNERRRTTVRALPGGERMITIDLQFFAAGSEPVTFDKTPFGPIGVRMAKTIGVTDGGGEIRNSAGQSGEVAVFRKPARWVDYSGPITATATEGITLLDHPGNPNHPNAFHVRSDGWMGVSLTLNDAIAVEPGKPLRLRYGLYVHAGKPEPRRLDEVWEAFAKTAMLELPAERRGR